MSPSTAIDPVKGALGTTTTCAAGSTSRRHAQAGKVNRGGVGGAGSTQRMSHELRPAVPRSAGATSMAPSVSIVASPTVAGLAGPGPKRSSVGARPGRNTAVQP